MNTAHNRRAFSLVELLVVLAITGVLMGLLVPVLATMRQGALVAQCANHLRQIGVGLHTLATEKGGRTLLAGEIDLGSFTRADLPTHLEDSTRRYKYFLTPLNPWGPGYEHHLMPPQFTLAPYISRGVRCDSRAEMGQIARDTSLSVHRIFLCPSEPRPIEFAPSLGIIWNGTIYLTSYGLDSSYAFNSAVFGWHWDPRYRAKRLRGQLIQSAGAQIAAVVEHAGESSDGIAALSPPLESSSPVSLADRDSSPPPTGVSGVSLKVDRHRRLIGILFLDGHVEHRTRDNLRSVLLSR